MIVWIQWAWDDEDWQDDGAGGARGRNRCLRDMRLAGPYETAATCVELLWGGRTREGS
jgi:hypothetical protein